jgi:hypothetical protein
MAISATEIKQLQNFLCTKFANPGLAVRARPQAPDSLEVLLNGEFMAVIYKDEDEGETSFTFNMAILDIDLEGEAAA